MTSGFRCMCTLKLCKFCNWWREQKIWLWDISIRQKNTAIRLCIQARSSSPTLVIGNSSVSTNATLGRTIPSSTFVTIGIRCCPTIVTSYSRSTPISTFRPRIECSTISMTMRPNLIWTFSITLMSRVLPTIRRVTIADSIYDWCRRIVTTVASKCYCLIWVIASLLQCCL